MNVNYAKNFIKEYGVKRLDTSTLETIIPKLGYKLIKYSPLLNSERVNMLIKGLNLKSVLASRSCFTYKSKLASYIFVRDNLEEHEQIHLLLHEIGHIYMHHIDNNITDKPDYNEREANKFADDVKYYVNQNRIKRKALYAIPAFLLSVFVVATIVLQYKNNKSNEYKYYQQTQETAETTVEATSEAVVIETATEQNKNIETLYYVTPSGKKYHLAECPHINPNNCIAITKEQAEKMGYEPCKDCNPDKQK